MAIKQRKGVKETPLGYRTEQAQYCTEWLQNTLNKNSAR
jgi:hypothetical protein